MNIRSSWLVDANSSSDTYCPKDETTASVIENFDIRRYYSAEGASVDIDGTSEQVLIQDHSNPLNENKPDKKIHVPMNSVLTTGSYVTYNSEKWITTSRLNIVGNAYKSAKINLCNYNLKFLSSLLQPISRYCYVTRTRSGTDVNGNPIQIELGDGKLSLLLPYDSETALLDRTYPDGRTQRLLVDFGSTTPRAYEIKDANRLLHGCVVLELEECERSVNDDVVNMIADNDRRVIIPDDEIPAEGKCEIIYTGDAILSVGLAAKKFSPVFYDSIGNLLDGVTPVWTVSMVNPALVSKVLVTLVGDDIYLQVTDVSMIGETVRLELKDNPETVMSYVNLEIKSSGYR